MQCRVLIAGAGPAGLAAALLLDQLGWRDIVVIERRSQQSGFDRGRAFNYQLDGRGQRLLERVGVTPELMSRYGLPNDHFTLSKISPDGELKVVQPPILVPGRKTPYWMTRSRLLELLTEQLRISGATDRIAMLDGHTFAGFEAAGSSYRAIVDVDNGDSPLKLEPELLLGCDGLNSRVRSGLADTSPAAAERMERVIVDSPSAGLTYKVLNLPASFTVADGRHLVNDHAMAFAFLSQYREPNKRLALFALPVAAASDPRPINIILSADHHLWTLNDAGSVRTFLNAGFPQIDVESIAGEEEFHSFVAAPPGEFPKPQYTRHIVESLPANNATGELNCVLVGDAAHAFPPDLGMGVNSALEDLIELEPWLQSTEEPASAALRGYAEKREPEHAALVRLVQQVHPFQYNQNPLRLKLWSVRFLVQLLLHRVSGGLIDMPGFMLSQRHLMPFTEMERRFKAGNRAFYVFVAALLALLGWLIF